MWLFRSSQSLRLLQSPRSLSQPGLIPRAPWLPFTSSGGTVRMNVPRSSLVAETGIHHASSKEAGPTTTQTNARDQQQPNHGERDQQHQPKHGEKDQQQQEKQGEWDQQKEYRKRRRRKYLFGAIATGLTVGASWMGLVWGYNYLEAGDVRSKWYNKNVDGVVGPLVNMANSGERWFRTMSTVVLVKSSEAFLRRKYALYRSFFGCDDATLSLLRTQHENYLYQQHRAAERLKQLEDLENKNKISSNTGNLHQPQPHGKIDDYFSHHNLTIQKDKSKPTDASGKCKTGCTEKNCESPDWLHASKMRELLDSALDQELHELHLKNAKRVLDVLLRNGGIYIKAGQFASTSLRGIIPDEYVDTLSILQDRIPSIGYHEVERIILQEFKLEQVSDLFSEFEEQPIAAASLGQVHRARLKRDGSPVAVKVQYPIVRKFLPGDLFTIKQILKIYWYQMPQKQRDANLNQLDSVTRELDFKLEAQNMRRSKKELQGIADLYIPVPVDDLITTELLVMEFIDHAVRVSDKEGLKRLSVDPSHVAEVLARTFCEQIFVHGFIHCDPHPGNILVRKNPQHPEKTQVVLLDHGLYQELSEEFRKNYLRLWYAILMDDAQIINEFCAQFGIEHPKIFVQALTFQFLLDKVDVAVRTNAAGDELAVNHGQFEEMKNKLKNMSFTEINEWRKVMESFPPELRLVMRNQMLSLGVNQLLGARVDRFAIQAELIRKLTIEKNAASEYAPSFWDRVRYDTRVRFTSLFNWIFGWLINWFIPRPNDPNQE